MELDPGAYGHSAYSSIDEVSISNIMIPGLKFFEWTENHEMTWDPFSGYECDGIIGLAPPWRKDFQLPSILAELESKGNLDAPMFSLELNTIDGGTGRLVIGADDKLLDHPDTIKLPVVVSPDPEFRKDFGELWTVSLKSVRIQSKTTPPIEMPLADDFIAMLEINTYITILPKRHAEEIWKAIGSVNPSPMPNISCDRVDDLPDLVFKFDGGQTVRLTAKEYVMRIIDDDLDRSICLIAILDNSDYGVSPNVAILGTSFLRGFHSIWDWRNRTVSCKLFSVLLMFCILTSSSGYNT
jgi:hypothetical protein